MISSNSVSSFYPKRAGKPPKKAPAVPKKTGLSKLPRAIVALLASSVGADSTSPITGVQTTMFPDAAKDGFIIVWTTLDGSINFRGFKPNGNGGFEQSEVTGVKLGETVPVQFPAHLLSGQISPDVLPDQIPSNNLPPIPPEKLTTVPADKLRGTVPIEAIPMITDEKLTSIAADKINGTLPAQALSAASLYHNPIGSVIHYPTNVVPTDYLECNGQTVRRDQYPDLFNVISVTYGPGDSVTTFKLPDYRGQFLRGWDHGSGNDPDRYSRTNRGDGRSGDYVGTRQDDEFKLHNHKNGEFDRLLLYNGESSPDSSDSIFAGEEINIHDSGIIQPRGGSETRPKNIAVMFIIRAK